jgi:hypothetical protein
MNSSKLNMYRIKTLQKFVDENVDLSTEAAQKVTDAVNSDQFKLISNLINKASKSDQLKYGRLINPKSHFLPIAGTEEITLYLLIDELTIEQRNNLSLLIEHAMNFSVFYLNIENKYRCRSTAFGYETPVEISPIVQEVTKEYLDFHVGENIKSRKFTGARNPVDLAPCTVLVRKILDDQNLGITQGLVNVKGTVKNFNRSSGRLEFEDQHGEKHEIHFNSNSFLSPEHELYYHDTDPSHKHQIEICFRVVESRKELLTLEIEPLRSSENAVQFQSP